YSPENDRGIAFNDPQIGIDWKIETSALKLSDKDTKQPNLKDADLFTFGENLYA
ncbi:MAG: dTDP-4-dehydrorhamnose 3,5-epimerase family protein, partial [Chlamydiia bacterium]|nr:dTDP-4-dehydrorhamnose 3,5-epimerase family protein [Chlamydiia bacterium]